MRVVVKPRRPGLRVRRQIVELRLRIETAHRRAQRSHLRRRIRTRCVGVRGRDAVDELLAGQRYRCPDDCRRSVSRRST